MLNSLRKWLLMAILAGGLLAIGSTLPVAGQEVDSIVLTINQVNDSQYPQVQVIASVTNQAGIPIEGLTVNHFSLFQDGNHVEAIQATPAVKSQQGIAVVLVIDTSGSMNQVDSSGKSAMAVAKEATTSFINSLDMDLDKVAIISFNSNTILTQPYSSDIDTLNQAIGALTADGETRLYDATFEAAELMATVTSGRKAIILLTDGQDTESRLTIDDVKDKAEESGVSVYTIGLGSDIDPLPLERLAVLTGGRFLESPTTADMFSSFNAVAEQLRQQYIITFESDMPANDRRHPLGLSVRYDDSADEDISSFVARSRPGSVVISSPTAGEEITGQTIISPTLQMPGKVVQVSFSVDSVLQDTKTNPPYTFLWDASQVESGDHILHVQAIDHVGNQAEIATSVFVESAPVTSESIVPVVEATIKFPLEGAELTEPTRLVVDVTDTSNGVSVVEFWVNGTLLDSISSPPYETGWDVTALEPGIYSISALVYDNQGNQFEDTIQVNVDPSPVLVASLTGLTNGQVYYDPAHLTVTVDQAIYGVDRVEFLDNGAVIAIDSEPPYEVTWDVDNVEQGRHTISVKVYDTQGNLWEDNKTAFVAPHQAGLPWQSILIGGFLIAAILGAWVVFRQFRRRRKYSFYTQSDVSGSPMEIVGQARDIAPTESVPEMAENDTAEHEQVSLKEEGDLTATETPKVKDDATLIVASVIDTEFYDATHPQLSDLKANDYQSDVLAYLIFQQVLTDQKQEYPLSAGNVSFGRGNDVDIMLYDAKVSRYHAEIRYEDGAFIFVDNQPTNPSYVNGEVYKGPHVISDGDQFVIGETKLVFKLAKR